MWDEPSTAKHLEQAGFVDVRRCEFGDSSDPLFGQVEEQERFVDGRHNFKELAMSARKP